MTPRQKKSLILTAILVLSSFICMFLANGIQSDNGKIRISEGVIRTDAGNVSYKLYKPVSATRDNKAPGVLLLPPRPRQKPDTKFATLRSARPGSSGKE